MFEFFKSLDDFFWGYIGFLLILGLGVFLTWKARLIQLRRLPSICKTFFSSFGKSSDSGGGGIHPVQAFFASIGGMIGLGNVVGVATAIQLGGPGALFWVWIAGTLGSLIKYSETFLGIRYRKKNEQGGYDGGPLQFLAKAFPWKWVPAFVAILLCIYGVEIYQFSILTESVTSNWHLNRYLVIGAVMALVIYAGQGGVRRIAKICSWVMPLLILTYFLLAMGVLVFEIKLLPGVLVMVVKSAFTGHAAVGGFAGSSVLLAIKNGMSRAAYSGDLGIGYDSMIQSEVREANPRRQARLSMLAFFIDNLVCTLSSLVVLVSGVWASQELIPASHMVQSALAQYFPFMDIFIPLFLLLGGYTTMIAIFCVGMKCAKALFPRIGRKLYIGYAILAFSFFSFFDQTEALLVMSITGALLLITNLLGIFRLRRELDFEEAPQEIAA